MLTLHRKAEAAMIVSLLVAVVLGTALASTVIKQSDNARGEAALNTGQRQGMPNYTDNVTYTNAGSMFALYPMLWAVALIAIVAGAVIKLL